MTVQKKFDKLRGGNPTEIAIERARSALLCARTVYARRKALRRLEDLLNGTR